MQPFAQCESKLWKRARAGTANDMNNLAMSKTGLQSSYNQRKQRDANMPTKTGTITNPALAQQLLDALDALSGLHPGFRPAHAKGLMCSGTFTPSPEAVKLTRAPRAGKSST